MEVDERREEEEKTVKEQLELMEIELIIDDMISKIENVPVKVCAICLENVTKKTDSVETLCKHTFHESCISPWEKNHITCPVCRTTYVFKFFNLGILLDEKTVFILNEE
jgi:hypothetical protein